MARTRIAVIGLGMASAPHARSLLDLANRVEVAACYSRTIARREHFHQTYGLPVTDDLEAIIADPDIKAALVLTPPNTHLDLVERLADAGKHILLEKPLEITTARAEALVAAADAAGVVLGVVLQNRYRAGCLALAAMIAEGRLGAILGASMRLRSWRQQSYYDQPGRGTLARDGGGVLLTQAIHPLDLLVSFAGLPDEVAAYATTSPIHRMETEDMATCALRFPNGALGTILATTCAYPGFAEEIDIVGEHGTATLLGGGLEARFHDGTRTVVADDMTGSGTGADPMGFGHQQHRALISDFLDAIEAGRQPAISGHAALKVHDLIDAVLVSAQRQQPRHVRRRKCQGDR